MCFRNYELIFYFQLNLTTNDLFFIQKDKDKAHVRSLTKTLDPVKKNETSQKDSSKTKDGDKSKEKTKEHKKDRERSKDRGRHKTEDAKKTSKEKVSKIKEKVQPQEEKVTVVAESEIVNNSESNIYNEEIVSSVKPEDFEMPTAMMNGEAHDKVRMNLFFSPSTSMMFILCILI